MNTKPFFFVLLLAGALAAQEAPTGSIVQPDKSESKRLSALKGAVTGKIVWASSRSNSRHDLWIMNADGTDRKQLTKGDQVDWYARFSPDGNTVLFTRSKSGWVPEGDAEIFDKWELWKIGIDGSGEKKVADNGCWGTWRPSGDSIVFARGPKVVVKALATGDETEIFDAAVSLKKGAYSQQPQLSPDGTKLAMTVRGSRRETGIWNLKTKTWYSIGGGCQMEWFPDGKRILRMNEGQGNGGTEVLAINLDEQGKPIDKITGLTIPKKIRFMDLPGRRSHEYFPKLDRSGAWLVWCATQYGHEHDIADYEVYLWKIGTKVKTGPVRLTFHSGNDRWPDIFTGAPKPKAAVPAAVPAPESAPQLPPEAQQPPADPAVDSSSLTPAGQPQP
ncbi:MAG: PD40 domain-containing protein [Chitinispirillaceae bacterium]|nr:PD40 domain-containing protein [Chitinispirillaceae bacterium]